jgi:hypothetical protein
MAGLDDLLGMRKIMPHEEVDIRRFTALVELHGILLKHVNKDFGLAQIYVGVADL